ncbi:alanine racemase [Salisaeta longa]|uniref:alanine racemase n=1 Tax=Salisaeta longa TaxID=503170 RepID=UPI00040178D7|nr:alanine racemase [Salisaeta longa]
MLVTDLPTPALLIDRARLLDNLTAMAERATAQNVRLRPHIKTHKMTALARLQQDHGADGVTVATVDEAEHFAAAGFSDVRVAYPVVGADKHDRLLALMADGVAVSFTVDTQAGIAGANAAYAAAGRTVPVLLEIDVGHGRCGVAWDADEALVAHAQAIQAADALRLEGLLTHAGQAYGGPRPHESKTEALQRASTDEVERLLTAAMHLQAEGLVEQPERFVLSVGSTPTMQHFQNQTKGGFRITEIRPGNYVFYDAMQVGLGAARLEQCALTVWSRVVSRRREANGTERVFVDAGKKILTTDTHDSIRGHGTVLYNARYMRPHPHAVIDRLSEEHGWLRVPGGATFDVGDAVRIVPNHACVTVATQDHAYLVDGDEVVGTWSIA